MFDETDDLLMATVANTLQSIAEQIIPKEVQLPKNNAVLQVKAAHLLFPENFTPFLNLISNTIGSLYETVDGPNWQVQKMSELQEKGLVYISYSTTRELVAFMSIKLVLDQNIKQLYLYEIHISPEYQGNRLGTKMINLLHTIANELNKLGGLYSCEATGLTVFSANQKAYEWYNLLGYRLSTGSPTDRKLRGKTIRPNYYIMIRYI